MSLIKIKKFAAMVITVVAVSCGGADTGEQQSGAHFQEETGKLGNPNNPVQNKGIGPVKSLTLGSLDQAMADDGQKIYTAKCSACHKAEERFIGPAPKGIMERRTPEWIMNMILNPEEMIKNDPIAKQLLIDFNLAPMANQHLTQDEARKILEYFRTLK